jgi:CRISPR-associated helicase Cas3
VQQEVIRAASTMDPSGILIVEAPMGEGKTEAALMAAEILAKRSGAGGLMVALPTQATSDAMFKRVMDWISTLPFTDEGRALVPETGADNDQDHRRSVFLAHGKAWLNPDFAVLSRRSRARDIDSDGVGQMTVQEGAYLDSWMTGTKKGVLADFVVGTIDQVLFSALQSRHVALRHLALARKVVILDEVHSFDAYMDTYLLRAIEWLGSYGVPVIALSATLPVSLREQLVNAYQTGRDRMEPVDSAASDWMSQPNTWDDPLPVVPKTVDAPMADAVLTFTTGGSAESIPVSADAVARRIAVKRAHDADVPQLLQEALQDGGIAVVIRNTVARAQETFDQLKGLFDDGQTMLLHSRFLACDRKVREQRLQRILGRPEPDGSRGERPDRLIVVATQVIEQSLDLDFDLMITDLAPTDLLLQRMGRLHRHRRPQDQRPVRLAAPTCVVVGVDDWSQSPPDFPPGSVAVYGQHLLFRAAAQLLHRDTINLPSDIGPLVQVAYGSEAIGPEIWQSAMAAAAVKAQVQLERQKESASSFLLHTPTRDVLGLTGWLDGSIGEADDNSRAQVRESDDSIEVLVVQSDSHDQWRIPDWVDPELKDRLLTTSREPSAKLTRVIAGCSVRLPGTLTFGARGDQLIGFLESKMVDAWQTVPCLKGQLVLALDDVGHAQLPGAELHYEPETGLTFTRRDLQP